MDAEFPSQEGRVSFDVPDAGKPVSTFYKIIGDVTSVTPLIALHGGPGAGHEYLYPLTDLYKTHKIPIVFYDQFGCANSTHFPEKLGDEAFWTFDLFIKELDNLIDKLDLRSRGFYVYGSSWGGVLAGTYASRQPHGLKKLVIASAPCDMSLYMQGVQSLLKQLPEKYQKVLEECEREEQYEGPEYESACLEFAKLFTCRLDPFPKGLQDSFAHLSEDRTAELTMLGPYEFKILGSLRDWEGWTKAHLINVETLLTNGRYDQTQDVGFQGWFKAIPKVKWVTLENSSHSPQYEERERYMQVLGEFLAD